MTDLSPAAQAVLDAFRAVPDLRDCPSIAAALRAAADQVVPQTNYPRDSPWGVGFADRDAQLRRDLLALAAELDHCQQLLLDDRRQRHPLADHARALLAEPDGPAVSDDREPASVAMQPSDGELLNIAAQTIEGYSSGIEPGEYEAEHECAIEIYGSELCAFARAVLARWGRTAAAPVPVSERLPGPEDCDAEGRCWLGGHQMGSETPTWLLGYPAWAERFPDVHRFWLPANALPLPPYEVQL